MLEFKDKQPLESTGTLKNEDLELDESIDSLPYVVKKMKIGEDRIEIAEEIKHVSHEHDLKLTEELLNSKKCDGCMHPIFPHPFYSCAQCRFFLHKSCVELPRKKRHPLHPHLLTLFTEPPYYSGAFFCTLCGRDCDGFTYNCEKCEFDADVQCSLISDIFTRDVLEHPLILSRAPYNEKCSCCDHEGKVFKCADCEFTLDLRCATLPHRVRYRYFEQPFKLCYNAEDDSDDDEYYCDICEKKRNQKYWFYYCTDLSFYAHPDCILGKSPYMK
ncbi:protein VACUOLELESS GAMETOPHYTES-like [Corylus avellana]|uniref:protein VACUOLELESS GAMETOPHYTES-like n=1 Tax=Corylus avellana TaxID=13451 RepID=UPI00286A1363|nr:protein VACUOLELESS GAMETOPHYTES-like [Corylus avellana]